MTKNLLLTAAAGLLSVSCAVQPADWKPAPFAPGNQRLSLGVNALSFGNSEIGSSVDYDENLIDLNGTWGYFWLHNVEVGAIVGYRDQETGNSMGTIESTGWDLGGFLRWYFDTTSRLRYFAQGRVGVGNVDVNGIDDDFIEFGIGVGLAQFLNDTTSIDVLLEWGETDYDNTDLETEAVALEIAVSLYF